MVALAKIKGLINDSFFAVDSPNSSAVGLRFSSGYRVSSSTRSTAHYRFALDQIYLTGARQHELPRYSTRSRTGSRQSPKSSASSARLLSGILRLLLELAREIVRHLLALVPHLDLDLDIPLALVLVLVLDDSSLLHDI